MIFVCYGMVYSQTASDYFPSQTGYKWYYQSVPLDSLNNPVNSQKFYSIDSFAVVTPYKGRNAYLVLTKTGPEVLILLQPYTDSLFFNFEGSNGFEYFNPAYLSNLLGNIDTTFGISFLNFFKSLEGWYSYYRLNSNINTSYTVYSKDTTVVIDSNTVPLRFQLIGKRLNDELINTAIGTFNCKKFLLERRLSYLVSIPPFPAIAIKILGVEETLWLAQGNWKVKSYIPSTNVDFSFIGVPAFNIPGLETNISAPITNIEGEDYSIKDFILYQNYPNPFNPITTIKYSLTKGEFVTIKIFNTLGEEIYRLVNEYKEPGTYYISFGSDAELSSSLTSGVYLYQIEANGLVQSKKMMLIK